MKPGKVFAILALVFSVNSVLACCGIPNATFFVQTGRLPLRPDQDPFKIPKGATTEDVRSALGRPHKRVETDHGEIWYYAGDPFDATVYRMHFDANGRLVDHSW
jgi:outer membrane protein assembly factor BamE (lipoprotein component of BamABCDE complex)